MKALDVVVLIVLLGMLAVSGYFLYLNLPGEKVDFKPFVNPVQDQQVYAEGKQFYKNMRFPNSDLTYNVESACTDTKVEQVKGAMEEIASKTELTFTEAGSNADILIVCSELAPEPEIKGHFVAGEGGPTEIINTSLYAVIRKGKMSLYREEKCGEPHISLHELLHVLGFDHNENPGSILYPTLNCNQKLDQYVIDDLNSLYKEEAKADLFIIDVNASTSGRYLNFDIEIGNQGLLTATKVNLTVYADTTKVGEFDLGKIDVGAKKILNVENARGQRGAKEITFVVDEDKLVNELYEDNNKVVLKVD